MERILNPSVKNLIALIHILDEYEQFMKNIEIFIKTKDNKNKGFYTKMINVESLSEGKKYLELK